MPGSIPNGTIVQGEVWTSAQWNTAWQSKADYAGTAFTGVADSAPNIAYSRTSAYTGGTAGFVTPCMQITTNIAAGDTNYEWGFLSVLNNSATAGQNVAGYFQGNKQTSTTGATWASVFEARDPSLVANPTTGLVGIEVDCRAAGTDSGLNRVGIDVVCTRPFIAGVLSGAAATISYGVRVGSFGDAGTTIGAGYTVFSTNVGFAFDCANATVVAGAMRMPAGAAILFDGPGVNQLLYDGIGLVYEVSGSPVVRFNQSGILNIGVGAFGSSAAIISQVAATTGGYQASYQMSDTLSGTTLSNGLVVQNTIKASTAVTNYRGIEVKTLTLASGATVANFSGLFVDALAPGGTLNAGVNLNLVAGANNYNILCLGTAQNQMNGPLGVNGATAPAQVTGWGAPTGGAVVASYNITDAGGANSNTNKAVAQIIAALKAFGLFGA